MKPKTMIKRELKRMEKRKKECASLYPEWRDDEFNCLEMNFLWGILSKDNKDITQKPSFATINDLILMYNRANNRYYLELSLEEGKTSPDKAYLLYELYKKFSVEYKIEESLRQLSKSNPYIIEDYIDNMFYISEYDFFSADSILELGFRLRILVFGFSNMLNETEIEIENEYQDYEQA